MNSTFEAFLKVDELDALLEMRQQITELSADEDRIVLTVLESWSEQQAVSNLLFCPSLIPVACREHFVLKGLRDIKNAYFILAAVVGVASLVDGEISLETYSEIKRRLIDFCLNYADVLGERASVSLRPFLKKDDLPLLLPLLGVRNDVVRENTVGWIAKTWTGLTPKQMAEEFRNAGLSWFQRRRVLNAIHRLLGRRSGVVETFKTAPLLSYIPNLKDVKT